jgi:hypothetical protein
MLVEAFFLIYICFYLMVEDKAAERKEKRRGGRERDTTAAGRAETGEIQQQACHLDKEKGILYRD